MPRITPNLWFDTEGEEAAGFYVSVFPNSRITNVSHYGEAGPRAAGTVLTVEFVLDGQEFTAINGGPKFTFDEAISLLIDCADQDEIDHYWASSARAAGGPVRMAEGPVRAVLAGRPGALAELLSDPDAGPRPARHAGDARDEEDRCRSALRGRGPDLTRVSAAVRKSAAVQHHREVRQRLRRADGRPPPVGVRLGRRRARDALERVAQARDLPSPKRASQRCSTAPSRRPSASRAARPDGVSRTTFPRRRPGPARPRRAAASRGSRGRR